MQPVYSFGLNRARYDNLLTFTDNDGQALWWSMDVRPRPCFSWPLIRDILEFQKSFAAATTRPLCVVMASETPGIFSLGGDLSLFHSSIENQDHVRLGQYAEDCVSAIYNLQNTPGAVTVAVLEGDALGAGLESALSNDIVIAERGVRVGFPEVLFNLVPGHGAYYLVARRAGMQVADKLIQQGNVHSVEELHELGLIDILVDKGQGRTAVRELIESKKRCWNAFYALQQIKRHHQPISREALSASAKIWVEAAMRLTKRNLRMMEHLIRAQERRAGIDPEKTVVEARDVAPRVERVPMAAGA